MIKLAIDLGSSVTKIYRADGGSGIVLAEPSAVAVDGITGEVKAIGKDAKKLVGKTTEFTEIEFPVYEGEIKNGRLAAEMLKEFLRRVNPDGAAFKKTEVLFALPCGAGDEAKSAYSLLAEECRLKNVYFAEVPYLAALGGEAVISDSEPVFVMDMGGGNTNIAVLSSEGIIAGLSMNIGGNNMDADIAGRVEKIKSARRRAYRGTTEKRNRIAFARSARRYGGGGYQRSAIPSGGRIGAGGRDCRLHIGVFR